MSNYKPKIMLVTGGAGFIGSHFIRNALKHHPNLEIINLDLLTYAGSLDNVCDLPDMARYCFIRGDICNRKLIEEILRKYTIDTIVHFAAESHVDRSIADAEKFVMTNVVGTFTLLEAARQYWLQELKLESTKCRFHHISTDEVYGTLQNNDPAFTELTPYSPNSPYSATKAGSDHLVNAYYETYKLPVTITNCSNNYGPFQNTEKFIPTVINSCKNWQPIPLYGNGKNKRDWLFVEDHCSGIEVVIAKGRLGEKYNIGGESEFENIYIAKKICQLMDEMFPKNKSYESLISFVTDRAGHDWRYAMDISKISSEFNWKPSVKLEEGLRKTIVGYINA